MATQHDSIEEEKDALVASDAEGADNSGSTEENTKSGIADVMAKILGKAVPKNKNPVLARGQTDREIQRKKRMRAKESGQAGKKSKKSKGGDDSSDWTDASDDDTVESRKKAQLKMQKVVFNFK